MLVFCFNGCGSGNNHFAVCRPRGTITPPDQTLQQRNAPRTLVIQVIIHILDCRVFIDNPASMHVSPRILWRGGVEGTLLFTAVIRT